MIITSKLSTNGKQTTMKKWGSYPEAVRFGKPKHKVMKKKTRTLDKR